jgi:hypothetical protein
MAVTGFISMQPGFFTSGQLTTMEALLNTMMSHYIMTSLGGSGGCKKGEDNGYKKYFFHGTNFSVYKNCFVKMVQV